MEIFFTVIHVIVALFMILVVLIQGGNAGGVGAAFGGGSSSSMFGATGATTLLGKLTYGAAAIFMATSIVLTVMQGSSGKTGLKEKLEKNAAAPSAETSKPTEEPGPAATTTPPPGATPVAKDPPATP